MLIVREKKAMAKWKAPNFENSFSKRTKWVWICPLALHQEKYLESYEPFIFISIKCLTKRAQLNQCLDYNLHNYEHKLNFCSTIL